MNDPVVKSLEGILDCLQAMVNDGDAQRNSRAANIEKAQELVMLAANDYLNRCASEASLMALTEGRNLVLAAKLEGCEAALEAARDQNALLRHTVAHLRARISNDDC